MFYCSLSYGMKECLWLLQYNMMSRLAKKGQAVEDATRFFGNELRDARPALLVYHNQCCGSGIRGFFEPLRTAYCPCVYRYVWRPLSAAPHT
jgi:hypothetical protein